MTTLTQTKSVATLAAAAHEAKVTDAWARYRELLERGHEPAPEDAAELLELAQIIGRTPADIDEDLRRVEFVRNGEAAKEEAREIDAQAARLTAECSVYDDETHAMMQERKEGRKPLAAKLWELGMRLISLRALEGEARKAKGEHPRLFGGTPPQRIEPVRPRSTFVYSPHDFPGKPSPDFTRACLLCGALEHSPAADAPCPRGAKANTASVQAEAA